MVKMNCHEGEGIVSGNLPKVLFETLVILENVKGMDKTLNTDFVKSFLETDTFVDFIRDSRKHEIDEILDFVTSYTVAKKHFDDNVKDEDVTEEKLKSDIRFVKGKIME